MNKLRVLGLDPRIGIGIVDYYNNKYEVIYFHTLSKNKFDKSLRPDVKIFGENLIFLDITKSYLSDLLDEYKPDIIVSEDAFHQNRYISAFKVLTSWVTTVALLLYKHNKQLLHTLAPKKIKKIITGNHEASKEEMYETLLKNKDVYLKQQIIIM